MKVFIILVDTSGPSPDPHDDWVIHSVYAKEEDALVACQDICLHGYPRAKVVEETVLTSIY